MRQPTLTPDMNPQGKIKLRSPSSPMCCTVQFPPALPTPSAEQATSLVWGSTSRNAWRGQWLHFGMQPTLIQREMQVATWGFPGKARKMLCMGYDKKKGKQMMQKVKGHSSSQLMHQSSQTLSGSFYISVAPRKAWASHRLTVVTHSRQQL